MPGGGARGLGPEVVIGAKTFREIVDFLADKLFGRPRAFLRRRGPGRMVYFDPLDCVAQRAVGIAGLPVQIAPCSCRVDVPEVLCHLDRDRIDIGSFPDQFQYRVEDFCASDSGLMRQWQPGSTDTCDVF